MNVSDVDIFRCPATGEPLTLEAHTRNGDEVTAGILRSPSGSEYPIAFGIPDFVYPPVLDEADAFAQRTYDRVADVYDEYLPLTFRTFSCDEGEIRRHMVDRLRIEPGQRILEVGAGTGRTSRFIADRLQGSGHIFVHDISRGILEKAVENLASERVERTFVMSNAVYLPFPQDAFDSVFHFGGLNMFSDIAQSLKEMVRVVKPGGRIVVGDESVPPWLRKTEFGKILMNSSSHYACPLPIDDMPVEARDVVIEYIMGGVFYLISFTVGEGEPVADFDFEIPGERGGTHRTRMYGQLEGVTREAKQLAYRARERRGVSLSRWLDEVVRDAARRDLGE
ncbi:MAG: class I SAM-dependent methyltransferase [Candidatus Eremiobacteraeota bacterium]|nr:class I SAM-dependent methyltransferase [Candidatus Eremiobacteraeota bacterium]